MQALSQPIDNNLLIGIQQHEEKTNFNYISGSVSEKPDVMEFKVTNTRIVSSRCCGYLLAHLTNSLVSPQLDIVMTQLNHLFIDNHFSQTVGKFARQRFSAALVVAAWADFCKADSPVFSDLPLINCLLRAAEESIIYNEVTELFTTLQTDCKNFLALLKHHKQPLEHLYPISTIFTVDLAQKLVTTDFLTVKPKLKTLHQNKLSEQADQMLININETRKQFLYQKNRVQCSVAISLISLKHLPPKLNPVIRPLVELIKSDYHHILLEFAGSKLSQVLRSCVSRQPCPNSKVFKNLCASLCSNPERTPNPLTEEHTAADLSELKCTVNDGILSLIILSRESAQVNETGRGRKSEDQNSKKDAASKTDLSCETALLVIMEKLGDNLLNIIPTCEEQYLTPIIKTYDINNATSLTHALQVIEIIYHKLPISIRTTILNQLPSIITCVKNELTVIRHMSARCLAACATVDTSLIMNSAMTSILPLIDTAHNVQYRQGAVETIYRIVDRLGVKCVPYIVLLIVPILGRMTDYDLSVQMMSSLCFASLIKLMPLEGSIPDPDDMNSELKVRRSSERDFLDQLLNGKPLQTYGIPITINTELRKYQQDGVNWLAFLNKYKLHGILCDDMGLGKTLQSVCIIAGDHHMRTEKYQETGSDDCLPLTSLVVCPSTLCAHWVYEVEKFVSRENLRTLNYSTSVSERVKLRERFNNYNLIVASYEIVRNDIDFLKTINWNYCVLDEGHMIKNAKSKTTRAVKQLHCNHRLILTGTPIQNNVLELWSLFDFLMPGYLGTERQFNVKYSRPILQSKDSKSTPKQQEQAALVIESLHKQVLPFLLRRLKTDVLKDLPPKIIQDYYCDLTPLQAQLYDQFSQSSAGKSITQSLTSHDSHMQDQPAVKGHIFQALQYLKKVCNHPALAVNSSHPRYAEITTQLKSEGSSIHDIKHSAKISSLRQLLLDCGIGDKNEDTILNQHRALIFFQHKSMIEIVERDLLHKQMPGVTFMKLDGSVPANNRHLIVKQFNEDPSIDLLLLTTTVGGLGLNLTGADTVIFFEHDWNPMKDLQAMDRAHRIGQTRAVNVYRLITKNTLEEKIMGLQKFKLNIANSVVNEENSNLSSMQTDQLLDLFTIESEQKGSRIPNVPSKGLQSMLQNMTELWDESEYEIEYDVNTFLASLSK